MDATPNTDRSEESCDHSRFLDISNPLKLVPYRRGPMPPWIDNEELEHTYLMRPWDGDRWGIAVGCMKRPHNWMAALEIWNYYSHHARAVPLGRIVFSGERFECQGRGGANPAWNETDSFGFTRTVGSPWQVLEHEQELVLPFTTASAYFVADVKTRMVRFANVEETPDGGILLHLKECISGSSMVLGLYPAHSARNTTMRCWKCSALNWWNNCTDHVSIGWRSKDSNNLCRSCRADLVPATWEEVVRTFVP